MLAMLSAQKKGRRGVDAPRRRRISSNHINGAICISRFADVRQSRTLPLTFQGQQHAQEDHHGHH